MSWMCKPHATMVFRTNSSFELWSPSSFAVRNARPSTAWLGDGVYCLHAEKSRYSVSFCELGQTKPNQHAAGHRHTGSNTGPGMLSNGSISHYTKCWRHFIEHMFFSVPLHLWLVYCHLELAAPTVGNLSLNARVCLLFFGLPRTQGVLVTAHFLLSVCGAQVCEGTKAGEVSGLWTCKRGPRDRDWDPFLNPHVLFFFIQELHWLHSPISHSEVRWPG